ncbi:MAG: FG-GAP repeat domain-containing protein [Thermoanaerobaculia bacterium]
MKRLTVLAVLLLSVPLFGADVQLQTAPIDNTPYSILSTPDFNGDGLDDLLTLGGADVIYMQFNLGGHFGPPTAVEGIPASDPDHASVGVRAVANINGDAFADLLVRQEGLHSKDLVLLGNGSGTFSTKVVEARQHGWVMETADFTGDGYADLLYWKPGQLTMLRGAGDGTFAAHQTFPWEGSYYWQSPPVPVDLNGDGRLDFMLTTETSLMLYLAQADGTFTAEERFTRFGPRELRVADLNGDGHIDIGFVSQAQDQIAISALYGDGTGRFPGYSRLLVTVEPFWSESSDHVRSLTAGDFVRGGARELAFGTNGGWVVLLSGMGGQLREVARVKLPALTLDVLPMRLRSSTPELVAQGHIRTNTNRFVYVVSADGEIVPPQVGGRTRAVQRLARANATGGTYRLDIESDCPIPGLTEWSFEREGLFVHFATSTMIESAKAAYLPGELYVSLQIKDGVATRDLVGSLTPTAEGLTGKLFEWKPSPCGRWAVHKVTAVATH